MAQAQARSVTRVEGVQLPAQKHTDVGLTSIYGIGRPMALTICKEAGIEPQTKIGDLTEAQVEAIRTAITSLGVTVEGDLRIKIRKDIEHLKQIKCFRGGRHKRGLPCRGQNTKNNARTRKGPKKIKVKK